MGCLAELVVSSHQTPPVLHPLQLPGQQHRDMQVLMALEDHAVVTLLGQDWRERVWILYYRRLPIGRCFRFGLGENKAICSFSQQFSAKVESSGL